MQGNEGGAGGAALQRSLNGRKLRRRALLTCPSWCRGLLVFIAKALPKFSKLLTKLCDLMLGVRVRR